MWHVIVALIPDDWVAPFTNLRQQHDRWSDHWLPPHITVLRPFQRDLSDAIVNVIQREPIDLNVVLGDAGTFRNDGRNTIWIDPGQADRERVTHRALNIVRRDRDVSVDVCASHFHITVVDRVPEHLTSDVLSRVQARRPTGAFCINRLKVYRKGDGPNDRYTLVP